MEIIETPNGKFYWVENGYESDDFPSQNEASVDFLTWKINQLTGYVIEIKKNAEEANRKLNLLSKEAESNKINIGAFNALQTALQSALKADSTKHNEQDERLRQILNNCIKTNHNFNLLFKEAKTMAECRSCGAKIIFVTTKQGKYMPCDPELVTAEDCEPEDILVSDDGEVFRVSNTDQKTQGYVSHFATCPKADQHRRAK